MIVIVIGEGGSGGALALGVGDRVLHAGVRGLLGDLARGLRRHPLEEPAAAAEAAAAMSITAPDCKRSASSTRSSPSRTAAPTPIPRAAAELLGAVPREAR